MWHRRGISTPSSCAVSRIDRSRRPETVRPFSVNVTVDVSWRRMSCISQLFQHRTIEERRGRSSCDKPPAGRRSSCRCASEEMRLETLTSSATSLARTRGAPIPTLLFGTAATAPTSCWRWSFVSCVARLRFSANARRDARAPDKRFSVPVRSRRSRSFPSFRPQSFRRARVGSTARARRAGRTHAVPAIATSRIETPANVTGSVGDTPHS